ncbi:DUF1707 domain-containing protein [Nocardioides agariphilus]|uniref:DUF1707 domain-containing protein n=2 Tax=Nocardioides agariphilus TaxID=433664 RepID=A0A930VP33_9ACTN|nr:DUF1707 domain-containing protein [Nocardioides agariphilus]
MDRGDINWDPAQLRVSDDDRHKVAEILREAAGEGRIDLDELDERLEATYSAKTYADLVPITVDLPAHEPTSLPVPKREVLPASTTHNSSIAVMGECKRQGAWLVPASHTAFALMGSVTLDLRGATFAERDITITANAVMAEVKVIIDAGTNVVVSGVPIMGEFHQAKDKVAPALSPDSPVVRVKGMALMGSVSVQRLPPPGTPKKILGTY